MGQPFASSVQIDRKIRFLVEPKSALAIKRLREQFHLAMSSRMRGRQMSERQREWFELGLKCIVMGEYDDQESKVVIT